MFQTFKRKNGGRNQDLWISTTSITNNTRYRSIKEFPSNAIFNVNLIHTYVSDEGEWLKHVIESWNWNVVWNIIFYVVFFLFSGLSYYFSFSKKKSLTWHLKWDIFIFRFESCRRGFLSLHVTNNTTMILFIFCC